MKRCWKCMGSGRGDVRGEEICTECGGTGVFFTTEENKITPPKTLTERAKVKREMLDVLVKVIAIETRWKAGDVTTEGAMSRISRAITDYATELQQRA